MADASGDALRSLARLREAAGAYARAAAELPAPQRQQAGYLAARLRADALDEPAAALAALEAADVTARGSPLRERGLALRVELPDRLGRDPERREAARTYPRDDPDGSRAEALRSLMQ